MIRNPVMFVVEVGSLVTTVQFVARPDVFVGSITLWLWSTVLFANLAEAAAEGRGKAQADTLRRTRQQTVALHLRPDGTTEEIPSVNFQVGDLCVVEAGQIIPGEQSFDVNEAPRLTLNGELDISTVETFRTAIEQVIDTEPKHLVLELEELTFMDSSGISVMVLATKHIDQVELRHASDIIRRVIDVTGLLRDPPR